MSVFVVSSVVAMLQGCAGAPKAGPKGSPPPVAGVQGSGRTLDPAIAEAAKGYSQVEKDGELLFCKRERQTGSNMTTVNCITEAAMRQRAEDAKKFNDNIRQQGRRCSNGPACQQRE